MIIELYVYENYDNSGYFMAESEQLCINSNSPSLQGISLEFWGKTLDQVLDQVKTTARSKYGSGKIRIVN